MYVVVTHFTEANYGPELTNVIGPFATQQDAWDKGFKWYMDLDAQTDYASVHTFEVRPIRTFETATKAHMALVWLYLRTDAWARTFDNPMELP